MEESKEISNITFRFSKYL